MEGNNKQPEAVNTSIYLPGDEAEIIDRAAGITRRPRNQFIRIAAVDRALEIIKQADLKPVA